MHHNLSFFPVVRRTPQRSNEGRVHWPLYERRPGLAVPSNFNKTQNDNEIYISLTYTFTEHNDSTTDLRGMETGETSLPGWPTN